MQFRSILFSFFLVFALGVALVHGEEAKQPRGPKVTSKVCFWVRGVLCEGLC